MAGGAYWLTRWLNENQARELCLLQRCSLWGRMLVPVPVCLMAQGTVWRRRGVQSTVVLVAVLSAPPVALTIVMRSFSLVQAAYRHRGLIPPGYVAIAPSPKILIRDAMYTNAPLAAGKYTPISVSIIAIIVVAVYATLFGVYRCNLAIDTPWYLSFSYNYCIKRIDTDASFGSSFPFGMGGTVAFGKLAAMVQCAALTPFNWSLAAANILSVTAVVLSMAAIFAFLVSEGFGRFGAVTCCLTLAVTEPFVAMANQSKYEYVTFLLAVCGLLLAARRHFLLAGLISVLAIEVQPIGIMAPIYLIAYELSRMIQTRRFHLEFDRVAKMVLGGVLGLAVYFILHPDILALLAASSKAAEWNSGLIHFLYSYFFEARLYRHLPELAVFAACLFVHIWRRDYIQWPFPIIASVATLFIGFFLHYDNYFYVPFWYFPSFLLVFLTISFSWRAVALPAFALVLFVPQYAVAYIEGRKYADQGELQVARSAIASRGTDLSHAHIFGDFDILARVQGPLVRVGPPGLIQPATHPARYKLSDLWPRSAVLPVGTRVRRRVAGFQ